MSDSLATALAAIRAEGYLDGPVPRLLKAVEAVLELHRIETLSTGQRICVACWQAGRTVTEEECKDRAVITRELTGGTDE